MNYSPDAFQALLSEVEAQGGAHLDDLCVPLDVTFEDPPYIRNHTESMVTCGCRNRARFVSEYDNGTNTPGFVTACAVCDAVGAWPRYADSVEGL